MDEPAMQSDLYEEAQHMYRRREELEAKVSSLCVPHMVQVIAMLEAWSHLGSATAEMVYALIELRMDEEALVEKMGPGWRVTDRGIAFSPLWGTPDA